MRQPPHSPEGLFRFERKARRKRFQAEACRGKQSDLISRGRMRRKRQKNSKKPPDGANFCAVGRFAFYRSAEIFFRGAVKK